MRNKPISRSDAFKRAAAFIAFRCGARWMAPFGGNDTPAFEAFCSLVELWCRADLGNRAAATLGLRGALLAMQEHCRAYAYLAIVAIGDWHMVPRLLPEIVPDGDETSVQQFRSILQRRGEASLVRLEEKRLRVGGTLLRLQLWPEGELLELQQLAPLNPSDLERHGWNQYEAFRWLFALRELARSSGILRDDGSITGEEDDDAAVPARAVQEGAAP